MSSWTHVLEVLRVAQHPALAAILERATVRTFNPHRIELAYPRLSLLGPLASEPYAQELLRTACKAVHGFEPVLVFLELPEPAPQLSAELAAECSALRDRLRGAR